jgi:hypothetical protein
MTSEGEGRKVLNDRARTTRVATLIALLDRLLLGQNARRITPVEHGFGQPDFGLVGVVREKGEGNWKVRQ